eukprot:Opistho-1_new@68945
MADICGRVVHQMRRRNPGGPPESLDYEIINNQEYRESLKSRTRGTVKFKAVVRWSMFISIGLIVACIYKAIHVVTEHLADAKFDLLGEYVEHENLGVAWIVNTLIMAGLVLVGVGVVLYQPAAGGSGIPEVLAFLNGAAPRRAMDFRTLWCKIVGITCAVGAGLALGPEGPMIHIGAMVGVRLVRDLSKLNCMTALSQEKTRSKTLRNDRDERIFIACGSAAGISAAFRAPIGGTLFVLEEAISFFNSKLIFRTYVTCAVAYYFLGFISQGSSLNPGGFTAFSLLFVCTQGHAAIDVVYFACLGIMGGILGAVFNLISKRIHKFRRDYMTTSARKIADAMTVVLITSTFAVFLPSAFPCTPASHLVRHAGPPGYLNGDVCVSFELWTSLSNSTLPPEDVKTILEQSGLRTDGCAEGEYNELASLLQVSGHTAIRNLFVQGSYDVFSYRVLVTFFFVYFLLALITAGLSIPSGLVIPTVTIGSCLGRVFAMFINQFDKSVHHHSLVDPGVWAMIGTAAFWCGTGRLSVTVAVIILEITGNFRWLPALAVAVTTAKLSGDFCSHSLYHMLLSLKGVVFLPDTPTKAMDRKIVEQIMQVNPVVLNISETVSGIRNVLGSNTHNGFPVVEYSTGRRRLAGLILREQLNHHLAAQYRPDDEVVDIGRLMHLSPHMVTPHFTASQAYTLFRNLGLRHLCVINRDSYVIGIITRKDLIGTAHYDEAMTDVEVFAEHTLNSLQRTVEAGRRTFNKRFSVDAQGGLG